MSKKKEKLLNKYLEKKRKQRKRDDLFAKIAEIDQLKNKTEKGEINLEKNVKKKKCVENGNKSKIISIRDLKETVEKETSKNVESTNIVESGVECESTNIVESGAECESTNIVEKESQTFNDHKVEQKEVESFIPNFDSSILKARQSLPIFYEKAEIISLIRNNTVVFIKGATGSGKTTQVPQFLLEAGISSGLIGITQPRRISTLSICSRINEEMGQEVCGYKIRYDTNVKATHRMVAMTDGILLKEIQDDFLLTKYSTIFLDEVHERSINLDVLVSLMKKIVEARNGSLKVVLMSASEDSKILKSFESRSEFEVPATPHKLSVFYEEKTPVDYIACGVDRIRKIRHHNKSILVFLPSKSDIYKMKTILEETERNVLPLHSSLSKAEQKKIYKEGFKIILSTNIAETSLTIPDVVYVIDSGLVKKKYVTPQGIVQYTTEYISKSSALQRAGRAGRTAPGICYRLYSGDTYSAMAESDTPRILYEPLDSLVLDLKSLGIKNIPKFPFLQPPPVENINLSLGVLRRLGILDKEENLTKIGKIISKLPIQPKLAKLLCVPNTSHILPYLIAVVSCLSVNFELKRNKQTERFFTAEKSDILVILKIFLSEPESPLLREAAKMNKFLCGKFNIPVEKLSPEIPSEDKKLLREVFYKVYADNLTIPNTDCYFFKGMNVYLSSSSISPEEDAFVVFEYLSEGTRRIFMKNVTVVEKEWMI
ncbi:putative pre-mRNA-splicing factor ATP-dependent RNA helicase dhx15 [Nosema granulosis]|uniref:Pre-mRNA-splicing factor ATP-dependent RNA helicase dhx15 n=1 Tax=Nosema granulosis TaxID=83296 RepID=A0A9P6L067_9MICR|nr:putative pre-mRNA-splicing factor ATP-dependent RNA helicase dhx15 [Nosema granulosis]